MVVMQLSTEQQGQFINKMELSVVCTHLQFMGSNVRETQHGEQAVSLTFDLLMFCCVDQTQSAQFSNIHGPQLRGNI